LALATIPPASTPAAKEGLAKTSAAQTIIGMNIIEMRRSLSVCVLIAFIALRQLATD
jgi:hypothetical protein